MNLILFQVIKRNRLAKIMALTIIIYLSLEVIVSAYFLVGTSQNVFTVGSTTNVFLVGQEYNPISPYVAAKPIILMIPGILLLGFILTVGFIGFRTVKQENLINSLLIMMIAFIFIGLALLVGMPLIMQGVDATLWFK